MYEDLKLIFEIAR